jgi:hypothetical protein
MAARTRGKEPAICRIFGSKLATSRSFKAWVAARQDGRYNQRRYNRNEEQFPDTGPLRRELYAKHIEFSAGGSEHTERCFMAGNRIGKTRAGACEMAFHLTGRYPHWWQGRRFTCPIAAWAAGSTAQTTRDTVQAELLGKMVPGEGAPSTDPVGLGTGMIPRRCIRSIRRRSGSVPDCVETAFIRYVSGGTSILGFKSYEQGRRSFEGTGKHVVWLDEEAPIDIYIGLTEVVLRFLPAMALE